MSRVLLLCWRDLAHPQGGGSEAYLESVGAYLAAQGHDVIFRTSREGGSPQRERRRGMLFSRGGNRLTVYPRALGAIIAARYGHGPLARRADGTRGPWVPDVIVDTQNGVPFFATAVTDVPVVLLEHHCHREQWHVAGPGLAQLGWFIESRLSPWAHRKHRYVTVSSASRDELIELGAPAERISIVHNGVDPLPSGAGDHPRSPTPRLVTLSRLVPHKRLEHAIDVVARLRSRYPDLHLDVIGSGWWHNELIAHATAAGVRDAVTFHGHVTEEEKHRILAGSWVHLMPSAKEGWGLAVIEAAQHAVPSLGYRESAGLRDSIEAGTTGHLVDTLDELAEMTDAVLADERHRTRLGEAAQRWAATFSWERTGERFSAVLDDVAAERAAFPHRHQGPLARLRRRLPSRRQR